MTAPKSPDQADRATCSRRQFLRGAGALVALPFLPSLLSPREAHAQVAAPRKRLLMLGTENGGVPSNDIFPDAAMLTERRAYADRQVRRGALRPVMRDGKAWLSPILSAAPTVLTPALAAKLNVLRGIDIPFEISHHRGGYFGNVAFNTGQADDATAVQSHPRRTVDQVVAWSPAFYPSAPRVRSVVLSGGTSWNYSDPVNRTGRLQEVIDWGLLYSSNNLFNLLFGSADTPAAAARAPIVDRVLEDYRRLRNGDRRLSTDDRRRLDDHMQRLAEVQRRATAAINCGSPARPSDSATAYGEAYGPVPDAMVNAVSIYADILVAAFACGACRVAATVLSHTFSSFAGDWHHQIAHKDEPNADQIFSEGLQRFFERVFLETARKLDAIDDGDGRTVLDNSLMVWVQEHGDDVHGSYSIPVITAGGAGGFLRTGNYVDYRNPGILMAQREGITSYAGLPWGQWLATVLQAMGIPRAEWEEPGGGYGPNFVGRAATAGNWYPTSVTTARSEILPFLRAGV